MGIDVFKQMADDAEKDAYIMKTLTEASAEYPRHRGQNMWIAATCGYGFVDSLALLGEDFKEYLERRWGGSK